jgi:hypothetical protein
MHDTIDQFIINATGNWEETSVIVDPACVHVWMNHAVKQQTSSLHPSYNFPRCSFPFVADMLSDALSGSRNDNDAASCDKSEIKAGRFSFFLC